MTACLMTPQHKITSAIGCQTDGIRLGELVFFMAE